MVLVSRWALEREPTVRSPLVVTGVSGLKLKAQQVSAVSDQICVLGQLCEPIRAAFGSWQMCTGVAGVQGGRQVWSMALQLQGTCSRDTGATGWA